MPEFFRDPAAPVQPDQYAAEYTALLDILRILRPRRILEIGIREGGTLYQWLQIAAPGGLVCGIDLPGVRWGDPRPGFPDVTVWRGWADTAGVQLEVLLGDSHARDSVTWALGYAPFDFVFIDGDHRYDGVLQDWEAYAPMVRRGGLVAIHDILPDASDRTIEGWRLWPNLDARHRGELVSAIGQTSRGIGLLYV